MTAPVDIVNRALSEIGARTLISSLAEASPAGAQATLQYNSTRQQVLRAAHWGFARKMVTLTTLGLLTDTPPGSPYPWLDQYLYPPDCLKFRYVLAPPIPAIGSASAPNVSVQNPLFIPWGMPRRDWRYVVAVDDSTTPARRVILSNVTQAIGVYTADVEDPDLWDPLFTNALVMALANKFVQPLTGNVALKASYAQLAEAALTSARVADGNEAVPSTDHVVDWMAVRTVPNSYNTAWFAGGGGGFGSGWGQWYAGWDSIGWAE